MSQAARTSSLAIDWCSVSRVGELQSFIQNYWRRDHILARDERLLRWQYINTAEPDSLSILIAEKDSRLVGMIGVIPFGFSFNGRKARAAWLTTWVSSPESRGFQTGIALLQRALQQGFEVVGTLGMNPTSRHLLSALRFSVRDDIPRWIRIVSPDALISLLPGGSDCLADQWKAWEREARQVAPPNTSHAEEGRAENWNESLLQRWDQAWQVKFAPHLLGTWRDSEFLRWRYLNHPTLRYEVRFAEDLVSGEVNGLLVYRVETVRDRQIQVVRVLEFIATERAQELLTRKLVQAAQDANAAFVDFYCTSTEFARSLSRAGFVPEDDLPGPLPNLFQPLEPERQKLNGALWVKPESGAGSVDVFGASNLYLTRADCDQDRPN
jgi:hypothetical protein